nr:hypothetical protein [Tanacetum cinerariifolium]
VLYKVEDIVTCLEEYVKLWDDWEINRYGNANLVNALDLSDRHHTYHETPSDQRDSKVQYDTTTDMNAHYSKITFASSKQVEIPPYIDYGIYDSEEDILFLENVLKDELPEAEKLEINPLIGDMSDTFLMGDEGIKFNPFKDIDDPVPIPRVFDKPLDSLDCISKTFRMTIINPLFDFDSKFALNLDNLIFDVRYEDSDESEIETIMDEV